ncbi:hypothetical protein BDV25DRAFT_171689 [Aspergillus avenaceus]|uniref:Transglycosylase SLT domain-containing protein n=1 Tax=Aspergillus avenaceus TaxID=36643 RepID=A0A5N6TDS8_ASPAV|nr:hypothetical protein BDV25DRAFT_171689 [Aspergillus avenaceus]
MKLGHFWTALWLLWSLLANAAPMSHTACSIESRSNDITKEQILAIAPDSSSCDNAPFIKECATAEVAAKNIAKSFETYKITEPAEQAAVIALMAMESGQFKYNKNHYPGVAGQGTRNMQSPAFNLEYAKSIVELSKDLASVSSNPEGVLNILLKNEAWDFGSGAWFLVNKCTQEVRTQLKSGSEAGWKGYISTCVGTEANQSRKEYWTRAMQALKVSKS